MKKELFALSLFLTLFTIVLFRSYVLHGLVPLPFDLLVSYYSPWRYEKQYKMVGNKPLGFDNLKLFFPFRKYTTEELNKGHIPLWNPYVFSGNVHLATYQSMIFYPLNILYHLLPTVHAWSILVVLQPILTALFTYLFLRSLHLSRMASVLGSLGFAFSGWMITNWEEVLVQVHTIMYLPLALYATNRIWEKKYLSGFLLLIFSSVFSIFGGFLQMSIYFFVTLVAWNLYRCFNAPTRNRWTVLISCFGAVLLSLGITALQWMPAAEAYLSSPRGVVDSKILFDAFLSPFQFLITFIFPDFWGNQGSYNYFGLFRFANERQIWVAIPVFLFGILGFFVKKKGMRFWKLFTLLTFSLGLNIPTSWIFYTFRIPIMSVAQPSRIFVLSALGLCVLAAYGFDAFFEQKLWKKYVSVVLPISIVLLIPIIFIFTITLLLLFRTPGGACEMLQFLPTFVCTPQRLISYAMVSLHNLVLPTVIFLVYWMVIKFLKYHKTTLFLVSLLILVGSITYQSQKILYFSRPEYAYPQLPVITKLQELAKIDRVFTIGEGHIMRNLLSYYRISTADGYEALFPQRYGELLFSMKTQGKLAHQITRTDADLSPPGQGESMTNNLYRLRLMQLLGVRFLVETKVVNPLLPTVTPPPSLFPLIWEDDRWRMYEFTQALPRAFLTNEVIVETDPQKQLDLLYNPSIDLSHTIILEEKPDYVSKGKGRETVEIESYEPETIKIRTSSDTDRILFLSDSYAPGWRAFVDGKETKIYRANFAFRGVVVPKGNRGVIFHYDPLSFKMGVWISGISGILILIFFFSIRQSK